MALKTAIDNLLAARKKYDEQLAKLGSDTGKAVAEFLGENIPPGFRLEWMQYTPYFNDGDACVFSVHTPDLCRFVESAVNEEDADDEEDEEDEDSDDSIGLGSVDAYDNPDSNWSIAAIEGLTREALQSLSVTWDDLPEEVLEAAFGDHAKIVIRKAHDGTLTWKRSEYEHD